MPDQQSELLNNLLDRIARLEAAASKPRGKTNMSGAARYLGRSDEWLRRQHALGRGPKRSRAGTRNWLYDYADLDEYVAEGTAA